jgi:hypothetical protein
LRSSIQNAVFGPRFIFCLLSIPRLTVGIPPKRGLKTADRLNIGHMKKAQPRKKRRTSAKAARTTKSKSFPKSVDEYIARLPEPAQTKLKQVRAAVRSVVPAETTEVISYGIPAFKQKRVLVWYAAFADHWSLFPTAAVIEQFK